MRRISGGANTQCHIAQVEENLHVASPLTQETLYTCLVPTLDDTKFMDQAVAPGLTSCILSAGFSYFWPPQPDCIYATSSANKGHL